MYRVMTVFGLLLLATPAFAAEVRWGVDGGGQVEGADGPVLISLEDGIHLIDPSAPADGDTSVEVFCAARGGLAAIVIPAPKPGPEDEQDFRNININQEFSDYEDEILDARRGDLKWPVAPEGAAADSSASTPPSDPPEVGSSADPMDEYENVMEGCSARPDTAGPSAWLLALLVLALRRRRGTP